MFVPAVHPVNYDLDTGQTQKRRCKLHNKLASFHPCIHASLPFLTCKRLVGSIKQRTTSPRKELAIFLPDVVVCKLLARIPSVCHAAQICKPPSQSKKISASSIIGKNFSTFKKIRSTCFYPVLPIKRTHQFTDSLAKNRGITIYLITPCFFIPVHKQSKPLKTRTLFNLVEFSASNYQAQACHHHQYHKWNCVVGVAGFWRVTQWNLWFTDFCRVNRCARNIRSWYTWFINNY